MTASLPPVLARGSGLTLGVVLPVAMFTANRSAALMVSIAAVLALAGVHQAGRLAPVLSPLGRPWPWLARFGAAFVALAVVSLFWSHAPGAALFNLGEFLLPLGAAALIGLCYRICPSDRLGLCLAIGIGLASLATIADLSTGMTYRHHLGIRTDTFVLNQTAVASLVLVAPMLWLLSPRLRWLGGVVVLVLGAAILFSDSGSAKLGMMAGAAAFVLASVWPRLTLWVTMGGAAVMLALAPWIGSMARIGIPGWAHESMSGAHSGERVDIWLSFGAAALQRPVLGSGLGSSTRMIDDPVAMQVAEPLRRMLEVGHPHNSFLQIWVELGATGAALGIAVLIACAVAMQRLDQRLRLHAIVLAAVVLSIATVSHGAWQGWWIAVVGAAVALFFVRRGEHYEWL